MSRVVTSLAARASLPAMAFPLAFLCVRTMSPQASSSNLGTLLTMSYWVHRPLSSPGRFLDDGCAPAVVPPGIHGCLYTTWRRTISRDRGTSLSTERHSKPPFPPTCPCLWCFHLNL
jgi:hypothetical protein